MVTEANIYASNLWSRLLVAIRDQGHMNSDAQSIALILVFWGWLDSGDVWEPQGQAARWQELLGESNESRFLALWRQEVGRLWEKIPGPTYHPDVPSIQRAALQAAVGLLVLDGERSRELLREVFDIGMASYLESEGYKLREARELAASLAGVLVPGDQPIADLFSITGNFALEATGDGRQSPRALVRPDSSVGWSWLLAMRLAMHQVPARFEKDLSQSYSALSGRFVYIDSPRPLGGRLPPKENHPTALQALAHLLGEGLRFSGAVVVPGADRTGGGWTREVRATLVRSGRLRAIVDLPKTRPGPLAGASLWWISNERSTSRIIAFDAESLLNEQPRLDPIQAMRMVGVLLCELLGVPVNRFVKLPESAPSLLGQMRRHQGGMNGLFGWIEQGKLLELDCPLRASAVLNWTDTKSGRETLELLDAAPLLARLARSNVQLIYVIGNNGQGKSLMLASMARSKAGRDHVVCISFGSADRFVRPSKMGNDAAYAYAGARTSQTGVSNAAAQAQWFDLMSAIHEDQPKLDLLLEVASLLEFGDRFFLMPAKWSARSANSLELDRIKPLSPDARNNADLLSEVNNKAFTLGLIPKRAGDEIVAFAELSSGEQHLLNMAAKLIFHVRPGSLVLLDEPELSMHVRWQRAIPTLLKRVSTRLGCSIVVATHSPLLIASASDDDACFAARNGILDEISPAQRRSVEAALFDAFDTYTLNNRQIAERCAAIVSQGIQLAAGTPTDADRPMTDPAVLRSELATMRRTVVESRAIPMPHDDEDLNLIISAERALEEVLGDLIGKEGEPR